MGPERSVTLPEPPGALRTQTALLLLFSGCFFFLFLIFFYKCTFYRNRADLSHEVTQTGGGHVGSAGEAEEGPALGTPNWSQENQAPHREPQT